MKAVVLLRAVMAWTLAFCCAVSLPSTAAEPDNDAQHANAVKVGEKITFSIEPLHDRDYFTLKSPGRGTLRFKLTQPLKKHGGLHVWWGEQEGREVRGGVWDRRVAADETCLCGIRSSGHSSNEVTNNEVIEGMFEFVAEHSPSEPNDTAAQAQQIAVGEPFSFTLSPLYDRDYFTLTSPGRGTLRFKLTQPLKQHGDIHVWWGEREGREVRGGTWDRWVEPGEPCVLGVRSSNHSFNEITNDEVIQCALDFVPEHAASEPNNTMAQAEKTGVGEKINFTLSPLYDRDYFTLPSPGRGILRFKLTKPLKQHGSLHVWWGEDAKGNEIRHGLWDRRVEAGETCIFGIRSSNHSFNEVTNDEVIEGVFEFVAEHSSSEPNDTAAQAQQTRVGEKISFTLSPLHDRDYFTLPSPGRGMLRFKLTQPLKQHGNIHVWWGQDAQGNELRGGTWDRRVTAGETCVFGVRSSNHSFNEVTNDEVIEGVFEFVAEHASSEPNDTAAQAQKTNVGEKVSFTLAPLYDRDYFTLTAPGRGTLRFKLTQPLKQHGDVFVWWEDLNGKELRGGNWDRRVEAGERCIFGVRSSNHSFNEITNDEVIEGMFEFVVDSLPGEPNDTPQQAQEVQLDTPFEAVFLPLHDRDYFKIASPAAGVIKLTRLDQSNVHSGLFPWWMRKGDGKFIDGSWDHRVAKDETAIFGLRSSNHSFNESASEKAVKMQAAWIKEPLDTEKGDTTVEAVDAEIAKPFRFALLPSYDRDFIRVKCPQRGVLKAVFPRSPTERVETWWQRAGSDELISDAILKVEADETIYLGLAPSGWSSDQVFEGEIRYADGAEAAGPQTRRWTFKIDRSSEPKPSPP